MSEHGCHRQLLLSMLFEKSTEIQVITTNETILLISFLFSIESLRTTRNVNSFNRQTNNIEYPPPSYDNTIHVSEIYGNSEYSSCRDGGI